MPQGDEAIIRNCYAFQIDGEKEKNSPGIIKAISPMFRSEMKIERAIYECVFVPLFSPRYHKCHAVSV